MQQGYYDFLCSIHTDYRMKHVKKQKLTFSMIEHILYKRALKAKGPCTEFTKEDMIIFFGDEKDFARECYEQGIFGEATGLIHDFYHWVVPNLLDCVYTNPFEYYELIQFGGPKYGPHPTKIIVYG